MMREVIRNERHGSKEETRGEEGFFRQGGGERVGSGEGEERRSSTGYVHALRDLYRISDQSARLWTFEKGGCRGERGGTPGLEEAYHKKHLQTEEPQRATGSEGPVPSQGSEVAELSPARGPCPLAWGP
ncbi:unnamed protein product [Lota lota]